MGAPKSLHSRITVEDEDVGEFRVIIARPPLRQTWIGVLLVGTFLVFLAILLLVFVTSSGGMVESLARSGHRFPIASAMLTLACIAMILGAWGYGLFIFSSLFGLFGRETITIDGETLAHRYEIGVLSKRRRFSLGEIQNVRYDPPSRALYPITRPRNHPGTVAFDYATGWFFVGIMLPESDARDLVAILKSKIKTGPVAGK